MYWADLQPAVTQQSQSSSGSSQQLKHSRKCPACSGNCTFLTKCETFKGWDILHRRQVVNSTGRCYNCLSPTHILKDCNSRHRCHISNQPHHTMLHWETGSYQATPVSTSVNSVAPLPAVTTVVSSPIVHPSQSCCSCECSELHSTCVAIKRSYSSNDTSNIGERRFHWPFNLSSYKLVDEQDYSLILAP